MAMRGRRPRGRSGGARTPIARASSAPRHAAGASAVSRRPDPGDRCPLLFSTSAGRLAAGRRGHAAHIIIKMIEITTRRRHKADPGTPGAAAHLRRRFWVGRARAARGPGPTPTAPPATAPRTSPGWGARAACARARGLSRLYSPPRRRVDPLAQSALRTMHAMRGSILLRRRAPTSIDRQPESAQCPSLSAIWIRTHTQHTPREHETDPPDTSPLCRTSRDPP